MNNTNNNDWGINRRTMMRGAAAAAIGLVGLPGLASASDHEVTKDLIAGQDTVVGTVTVSGSAGSLDVEFDITAAGWRMTESHVHISDTEEGFPTTRKGNPQVGQFEYSATHDPAVTSYTYGPLDEAADGYIAAHAVVEEIEPGDEIYLSTVESSDQGTTKSGEEIGANRSDPNAALVPDYPEGGEFFSLGFNTESETGGELVVAFGCQVLNGEGADIRIWEVTFGGGYPDETAEVYAWDEVNEDWVLLGIADNRDQGPEGTPESQTISEFDLGDLDSTSKIKLVDTTNIEDFPNRDNADGFDVDGIEALNGCILREETAWGDGTPFVDRGNWATYFEYDLSEE